MVAIGVIVSSGKAYALTTAPGASGRLNLTQASLDDDSTDLHPVTLRLTFLNKSTVVIARLLPGLSESLHLDLRFNLSEEVIFSVRGSRSIHLAGYFDCLPDSSESFGEDVVRSESEEKPVGDDDDDDEYGGSFINDSDPGHYSSSPATSSFEAKERPRNKSKKPIKGSTSLRRHKKEKIVDSNIDGYNADGGNDIKAVVVSDSDDEIVFYENSLLKKRLGNGETNEGQSLKAVKQEQAVPNSPKVTKDNIKKKKSVGSPAPVDVDIAGVKCPVAAQQVNVLVEDDVVRSKKGKRKKHQTDDSPTAMLAAAEDLCAKNEGETKKKKKKKSSSSSMAC